MKPPPRPVHPDVIPEPRLPALVAVLALGGLFMSLHSDLVLGPQWLLPATTGVLLIPPGVTHRARRHDPKRILGVAVTSVVTFGMVFAVCLLISLLPSHRQSPF